ncbi:MAG: elongation factor G [Candidatus Eisenbacteria bacterium]|nr:elongation factor G [Candidatus Eisenbacteria bacterium]
MDTHLGRLRNIGIIAHIDAGKTTTTERILYYSGVTHAIGEVDAGSTQMDWMEQERERGITITSAATRFVWRDHDVNLIDTPGHVDFTAEVERSLRVLDGAVVVLCAVGGVEPQSEMVWHQAERYHVPCLFFVNKLDRLGASFEDVLEDIRATLGVTPVVTHLPVGTEDRFRGVIDLLHGTYLQWDPSDNGVSFRTGPIPAEEEARAGAFRQALLEAVAGEDDLLLSRFLDGGEISAEEIVATLRRATLARRLFPVLSGASLRNIGIQPLLDAIVDYLPAPDEVPPPVAVRPASGEQVSCPADPGGPLLGFVFKTFTERERGRASYIRLYSGRLREGMTVQLPRLGATERIARLFRVHADKRQPLKEAGAGDIVVATGLKLAMTGDTLSETEPLLLEGLHFPEPVVSAALEARSAGDEEKITHALEKLSSDDPTFKFKLDESTGQTVIAGMGELHLQILEDRLVREFGLKVRMGKPQVTYRETIREPVRSDGLYDRFTGGRQHLGELTLVITPLGRSEGFRFIDRLPAGTLAPAIVKVVEQACVDAKESGIQFGYPVTDVEAALVAAHWSDLNSTDFAFRNAALSAFRDGCRRASPVLLEPIVSLEIVTPKEFVGAVMGLLGSRQGRVVGGEAKETTHVMKGEAPLSRMFGFETDLRSVSQGRASSSMLFSHFDLVRGDPSGGG